MTGITRRVAVSVLALVLAVTAPLSTVNAATGDNTTDSGACDYSYYRSNHIVWDDECQAVTACSTSDGTADVTSVSGGDNAAKIFNFFLAKGLTAPQAAGVLANIKVESGFSPTRQEDSQTFPNGGWGLTQWTGSRRDGPDPSTSIKAYIQTQDSSLLDYYKPQYGGQTSADNDYVPQGMPVEKNDALLIVELNFIYHEISQVRYLKPAAIQRGYGTADDKELDALKNQTTAADAAKVWVYSYEVPADIDATAEVRAQAATALLAQYQTTATGTDDSQSCDDSGSYAGLTGTYNQKIVTIAKQELAKWDSGELKPGSGYTKYLQGDAATYWCAYFASWVYKTAGIPITGGDGSIASVSNLASIAKANSKFTYHDAGSYTPQPGDLAIYDGHVNIVVSATSASSYYAIGGDEHGQGDGATFWNSSIVKQNNNPRYWPQLAIGFVSING